MMTTMKRTAAVLAVAFLAGLAFAGIVHAQQKTMSIGTGGTGGVYYPLGGAVANVLSKALPNVQATAEVTGGLDGKLQKIAAGPRERGVTNGAGAPRGEAGAGQIQRKQEPVQARLVG